MSGGASPDGDRATRASTKPASGLGHSAGIPSAKCPTCGGPVPLYGPADFSVGQRVVHTTCGEGTVLSTGTGGVSVKFDGGRSPGLFDGLWFRNCARHGVTIVPAQAIEARRAETQSGSVHESAVAEGDAP